jgi:GxxExxY protein
MGATAMTEPSKDVNVLSYEVIGAAIEVHRHLGLGFLEGVYEQALAFELELRGIGFERQKPVFITYKAQVVGEHRIDFVVGSGLIVELKSVDCLAPLHQAQLISYLKATCIHLGLLINFNEKRLKNGIKRIVLT